MGIKGDKMQKGSIEMANYMLDNLNSLKDISSKKMFGGHGIFYGGKMFAMVDSKGNAFLKSDDSTKEFFLKNGAERHSKMPYYSIPASILEDRDKLITWSKKSIDIIK